MKTLPCAFLIGAALAALVPAQSMTTLSLNCGANSAMTMVLDEARQRLVLAPWTGDLIEWDGNAFANSLARLPSSPIASAYDPTRRTVFFAVADFVGARLFAYDGVTTIDRGLMPITVHAIAFDTMRNRLMAFGTDFTGSPVQTAEWDGTTWTLPMPAVRPLFLGVTGVAFDLARNVTVVMGFSFSTLETWEWNGTTWTLAATQPPSANAGRLAFDPNRQQVIMAAGGTLAWNGTAWLMVTPPAQGDALALATDRTRGVVLRIAYHQTVPRLSQWNGTAWVNPVTLGHPASDFAVSSFVFDEVRRRAVLFGAQNIAEWDGQSWTEESWSATGAAPSPRFGSSFVFDSTRGYVLMFGGIELTTSQLLGDTWRWSGSWQLLSSTGPPARFRASAADVRPLGRVVLIGGGDLFGAGLTDRWEWNGSSWQAAAPGPAPIVAGSMGHDEARNRLVLHADGNTWEEIGGQWQLQATTPIGTDYSLQWDPGRQRLQMADFSGSLLEWDGTTWLLRGQAAGGLAYDRRRRLLLVAGLPSLVQWSTLPPAAFDFGAGCGSPVPTLLPFGLSRVGNVDFHVDLRGTGGVQIGVVVLGSGIGSTPLGGGCSLFVQQPAVTLAAITNAAGFLHQNLPIPDGPALRGLQVLAQGVMFDPTTTIGLAMTKGLRLVIGD